MESKGDKAKAKTSSTTARGRGSTSLRDTRSSTTRPSPASPKSSRSAVSSRTRRQSPTGTDDIVRKTSRSSRQSKTVQGSSDDGGPTGTDTGRVSELDKPRIKKRDQIAEPPKKVDEPKTVDDHELLEDIDPEPAEFDARLPARLRKSVNQHYERLQGLGEDDDVEEDHPMITPMIHPISQGWSFGKFSNNLISHK